MENLVCSAEFVSSCRANSKERRQSWEIGDWKVERITG